MLLPRETDYALRILRSLLDGERKAVGDISREELIPQQFAYKIIKKLSRAGLVRIARGVDGGCELTADLEQVSLYDLMAVMEDRCDVNACMDPDYRCPWQEQNGTCRIHQQLAHLQQQLDGELRALSLKTLLGGA